MSNKRKTKKEIAPFEQLTPPKPENRELGPGHLVNLRRPPEGRSPGVYLSFTSPVLDLLDPSAAKGKRKVGFKALGVRDAEGSGIGAGRGYYWVLSSQLLTRDVEVDMDVLQLARCKMVECKDGVRRAYYAPFPPHAEEGNLDDTSQEGVTVINGLLPNAFTVGTTSSRNCALGRNPDWDGEDEATALALFVCFKVDPGYHLLVDPVLDPELQPPEEVSSSDSEYCEVATSSQTLTGKKRPVLRSLTKDERDAEMAERKRLKEAIEELGGPVELSDQISLGLANLAGMAESLVSLTATVDNLTKVIVARGVKEDAFYESCRKMGNALVPMLMHMHEHLVAQSGKLESSEEKLAGSCDVEDAPYSPSI